MRCASQKKINQAAPPTLGEHTDQIMVQLGYSAEEIAEL